MIDSLEIRHGALADAELLAVLFDEAVVWLAARGQTGQWGAEPFSSRADGPARIQALAGGGGLRVAELAGQPVGALVVEAAPPYAPVADRAELCIRLLLTSRRHAGRGLGVRLVEVAEVEARAAGCELLRVDCWAEAPALVDWYERQGFTRSDTFELDGWRGQIFEMALR